jgi:hypothetical protein
MKDKIVSFETAKLAKQKGFNITCDKGYYITGGNIVNDPVVMLTYENERDFYYSPTQSLLQKWLRENHNLHITVIIDQTSTIKFCYYITYYDPKLVIFKSIKDSFREESFDTYELAIEYGLNEALNTI